MSMLDINTKKGQISLFQENNMIEYISQKYKSNGITVKQTEKDKPIEFDGFLYKNENLIGIFETKCRDLSYNELLKFGSWLITYEKLEKCRDLTLSYNVPFYGFLYLLKDHKVLIWKIAENGKFSFDFEVSNTETQRTINGGKVFRNNGYLPVKFSKFV